MRECQFYFGDFLKMKVRCGKCGAFQIKDERQCVECGADLGGFANEKSVFMCLAFLALIPIFLFATSSADRFSDILDAKVFFWYYLPLIGAFLVFYDYHPVRRAFYFYGTAVLAVASLVFLDW